MWEHKMARKKEFKIKEINDYTYKRKLKRSG